MKVMVLMILMAPVVSLAHLKVPSIWHMRGWCLCKIVQNGNQLLRKVEYHQKGLSTHCANLFVNVLAKFLWKSYFVYAWLSGVYWSLHKTDYYGAYSMSLAIKEKNNGSFKDCYSRNCYLVVSYPLSNLVRIGPLGRTSRLPGGMGSPPWGWEGPSFTMQTCIPGQGFTIGFWSGKTPG